MHSCILTKCNSFGWIKSSRITCFVGFAGFLLRMRKIEKTKTLYSRLLNSQCLISVAENRALKRVGVSCCWWEPRRASLDGFDRGNDSRDDASTRCARAFQESTIRCVYTHCSCIQQVLYLLLMSKLLAHRHRLTFTTEIKTVDERLHRHCTSINRKS